MNLSSIDDAVNVSSFELSDKYVHVTNKFVVDNNVVINIIFI